MNTFRGISRRHLIRTGAAASVLAATGLGAQATPRRGGTLRIAAPGPAGSFPFQHGGFFGRFIAPGSVFDCLTEIGPEGELRGELAESWHSGSDARSWRISLKRGIRFHDGRPLSADDVAASLQEHVMPEGVLAGARLRIGGPQEIKIHLPQADSDFPLRLADPSLIIRPAEAWGTGDLRGTGPYRVAELSGGDAARLVRAETHDGDRQSGWFEGVELLHVSDPAARLDAVLSGRVDVAADIDPLTLPRTARPFLLHVPDGRCVKLRPIGRDADRIEAVLSSVDRNQPLWLRSAGERLAALGLGQIGLTLGRSLREGHVADALIVALNELVDAAGCSLGGAEAETVIVAEAFLSGGFAGDVQSTSGATIWTDLHVACSPRLASAGGLRKQSHVDLGRISKRWFFT